MRDEVYELFELLAYPRFLNEYKWVLWMAGKEDSGAIPPPTWILHRGKMDVNRKIGDMA